MATSAKSIPQPEPPTKYTSTGTAATTIAFDLQSDVGSTVDGAEAAEAAAATDEAEAVEMMDEEQGGLAGGMVGRSESGEEDDGGVTNPLVHDGEASVRHRPRHFLPSVPSVLRSSVNRALQGSHTSYSSGVNNGNCNSTINNRKDSSDIIGDIDVGEDDDDDEEDPPASRPPLLRATDLTLPEKLLLVSGKSLWTLNDLTPRIPSHILPSLRLSDGPHGVRKPLSEMNLQQSHPATCFPTAAALACSWDGRLLQKVGVALRLECLHYGISILLGPGMNLKRHSAGGRNFEYFSEDPLLTARCAAFYIHGIQATGQVAACAKHYAVNNQESHRFVVNAKIDERTCRELYLRHFEYICKAPQEFSSPPLSSSDKAPSSASSSSASVLQELGPSAIPATLMCSYNKVNGVHCSEHSVLLNDILRREWGYQGVVMTDWGATNNRAMGLKATLDLEMPGSHGAHNGIIRRALKTSSAIAAAPSDDDPDNPIVSLSENSHLNPCVDRILNLIHDLRDSSPDVVNASANTTTATTSTPTTAVDWESHHELAKQVAMECAVLLKNDDSLLPLQRNTSVAVIGDFAKEHPRYQGMGSSQVFSECVVSALTEFQSYTNQVYFSKGYHADDEHFSYQQEQHQQSVRNGDDDNDDMWIDTELLDQAVLVAQKAEVVVLCIGLPALMESEGFDRPHLCLPAQHNALVHEICRVHKKVVVVLSNGGAVEMPWADEPQAIFEGYLLGEMGGAAVVDLIFGQQSPCGKLAETVPIRQSDILADAYFPGTSDGDGYCVEHREGLQVGYRYFDSAQYKAVQFPFGHGLTYTTFAYSNLQITIRQDDELTKVVDVSFSLTNTGKMAAKEIVQVYVHHARGATVFRPEQELRDFDKILLQPNEAKQVCFTLNTNAFGFYDIGHRDWIVEPHGAFEIRISASSRNVQLRQSIQFTTGRTASALAQSSYPPQQQHHHNHDSMVVDDATFIKRFGANRTAGFEYNAPKTVRSMQTRRRSRFHRNSLLKQVADNRLVGRILLWSVYKASLHQTSAGSGKMTHRQKVLVRAAVENLPLRALVLFSKRALSFELLDVLIALFNYQVLRAIKCLCVAMVTPFRNK